MKSNTPELLKFKRLQRRLKVSTPTLCGHLELLWISTSKNAPEGDIGRFSNEEIAIGCYWDGDPDEFVNALVECGWLDQDDEYRLLVHDWAEHSPTWVRGTLKRHGRSFRTPTSEPTSYQSEATKEPPEEPTKEPPIVASYLEPTSKSSQVKPSQAKPSERGASSLGEPENPLSLSSHGMDYRFQKAWGAWLAKQAAKSRRMDAWTEQGQLKELERFATDEAIAIVEYSTSRTNCVNLITNGDHKRAPPEAKSRGGRKVPTFEEMELS
jgi:hypothetical protein